MKSQMRLNSIAVLLLVELMVVASPGFGRPIYGLNEDDRKDLYEIKDEKIRRKIHRLARSVTALFKADKVQFWEGGVWLKTETFGKEGALTEENERFYGQPTGSRCSGFLVTKDIVSTAKHCIYRRCSDTRFVFDFSIPKKGHDPTSVPWSSVYSCQKVLKDGGGAQGGYLDYAFVQLDRPVTDRDPLPLADRSEKIGKGKKIFVIGNPLGLPTKVAGGNSKVRASEEIRFVSDLDIFKGNSGSPVFDAETNFVIGMVMSSGDEDFETFYQGRQVFDYYLQDPYFPFSAYNERDIILKSRVISQDEGVGNGVLKTSSFIQELHKALSVSRVAPSENLTFP